MDSELKQYLDEFRQKFGEIDVQFQEMREENAVAHEETRRVLRAEIAAAHHDSRLHVESTVDRMHPKLDLLVDGIRNVDEKLDREAADIRAEMRQGFADTHALIRFSHAQRTRRAKH